MSFSANTRVFCVDLILKIKHRIIRVTLLFRIDTVTITTTKPMAEDKTKSLVFLPDTLNREHLCDYLWGFSQVARMEGDKMVVPHSGVQLLSLEKKKQNPYKPDENGYVGTYYGRDIKANVFTKDSHVDPTEFDALYGKGLFEGIVKCLIESGNSYSKFVGSHKETHVYSEVGDVLNRLEVIMEYKPNPKDGSTDTTILVSPILK